MSCLIIHSITILVGESVEQGVPTNCVSNFSMKLVEWPWNCDSIVGVSVMVVLTLDAS